MHKLPKPSAYNNNSNSNKTQFPTTTKTTAIPKCATVTMMLAERIKSGKSNWSVDDEHFLETANTMNVWQTLEFLSGINLRKRYHYEGYADTENIIRSLTPSWRRDSFVEKAVEDGGFGSGGAAAAGGASKAAESQTQHNHRDESVFKDQQQQQEHFKVSHPTGRGKGRKGKKSTNIALDPEYALSPSDYTDLIKCNFNLPRISACLERLMGTNVVRLTDRKYMKELRERIEEDYRVQLQKRINARELKEVERERLLIIEGKSDVIPEELAEDPIFVVNKAANIEIQKTRAKLKTNRERNSERLKLQGIRWERERLQHEEEERQRLEILRAHRKEQKELVEKYTNEDADRGMDLLRIHSEDWRECEQELKAFLERERIRMKERSNRVPTAFSSDPQDIQNIVRARQKFRETEKRIRHELDEKHKDAKDYPASKEFMDKSAASKVSKLLASEDPMAPDGDGDKPPIMEFLYDEEEDETMLLKVVSDDASDLSSESELAEIGSTISESKRKHAAILDEEMETDVQRGLLISKDQYEHLRYEEAKIVKLRQAQDIRELYRLAVEIVIGEQVEEPVEEEEQGEEEEDTEEHDHSEQ